MPSRRKSTTAPVAAAPQLSRALQSGSGHIAVIGADRATACAYLRAALVEVDAVAVMNLSAASLDSPPSTESKPSHPDVKPAPAVQRVRGLMARLIEQSRAVGKPAYIVVEDADAGDAAALERTRVAVECAPDAIKWLRIVLVGGERLEEILNDPAAGALSSRIGARVRVPSSSTTPSVTTATPAPASSLSPVSMYATLAAFAGALVSLLVWSYAPEDGTRDVARNVVAKGTPASGVSAEQRALEQAAPQKAAEMDVARPEAPAAKAPEMTLAATPPAPASETQDEASRRADQNAALAKQAPPSPAAAPKPAKVESAASKPTEEVAALAPAKPQVTAKTAPARSTVSSHEKNDAAPKAATARPLAVAGAAAQRDEPEASGEYPELEAAAVTREVMVEAGSFKQADLADAARGALEETFDHVLVVRLDPADGTSHYSVRVVGLRPHEVADVEAELRRLGYAPTRYETPSALARLGRKGRSFLAGLF